ncbi:hypothetical protein [Glycomyces sp. NPDC048151]|uniref:hypothetical protein n=1 Tax=Glycomyces sp. NPDC048151 TaxID=3364002 RepID=UPI00371BDF4B
MRHNNQRWFTRKDLTAALAGCHWYLISESPTIRIVPGTASTENGIRPVSFASAHPYYADKTLTFGAVFADGPTDADFRVLGDDNYFSFRFGLPV